MFEVGQQVVALESMVDVVQGGVYTISQVLPPITVSGTQVGLRFVEVQTQYLHPGQGYGSRWFRPLAKRSDTLTIESFLTIKPGQFEEPRRVVEPVKEVAK